MAAKNWKCIVSYRRCTALWYVWSSIVKLLVMREDLKLVLWWSIWNSENTLHMLNSHMTQKLHLRKKKKKQNNFSNGNTKPKDVLKVPVQNKINKCQHTIGQRLKRSSFFWVRWRFLKQIPQFKLLDARKYPCSSSLIWCCSISHKWCKTQCAYLK